MEVAMNTVLIAGSVLCGELFRSFYLWGVTACGFAHAGVDRMSSEGKGTRCEGAKAARSSCDDDDVLHIDSPVLRVV
jgi:hypothetical protein